MQKSYENIIDLNFIAAHNLLEIEFKENPSNKIIILHQNYIDFLKIIVAEEEQLFNNAKVINEINTFLLIIAYIYKFHSSLIIKFWQ